MPARSSVHSRFVSAFHTGDVSLPATTAELDAAESSLTTTLPQSYRDFALVHGEVYTPDLLDMVVDLDHPDIQNLESVAEIAEATQAYWEAGMPDDIVGFASDCMGNMFAFERRCRDIRPDDLPVLFFDHEFITVEQVAKSFDLLLSWYLALL